MGLEPTRAYTHKILSLACLPIPALPQHEWQYSIDFSTWQPFLTNFFNFFQKSNLIKNLKNNIDKSLLLIYNNLRCLNKAAEQNKMQKWRNWQTRTVQVRVVVIPCGFDSHLLHWFMEQEAEWLPVFAFPVFFWNPVVFDVFATDKFHHKR